PSEFVGNPIDSVRAAFHFDLWPLFCHHPEKSITIQDSDWLEACIDHQQRLGPISLGLQCGVTKPKIERQGDDEDGDGEPMPYFGDRKSTRLNSSHRTISYAV